MYRLSDQSTEPLYEQLAQRIREQILHGQLPPGAALPSIRELAAGCRISVITVKKALEILDAQGLVQARQGRGVFVADVDARRRISMAEETFRVAVSAVLRTACSEGISAQRVQKVVQDLSNTIWKGKLHE